MDQRRHGNRVLDRGGHRSSGISTSDRGHLSWLRVWHHGGVEIDAATSARSHHPDRVGSALAYRGIPLQAAYCGAKHAIRGFTNSLRTELLHEKSGITVSIVELPAVNTPQFDWARAHIPHTPRPMGNPVEPEVVADAVFRVALGSSREYWLGLQTILTILGNSIAPGYLDRYLARKAVAGQQTGTPLLAGRDDNLDHPVTALHRTRGSFSEGSSQHAPLVEAEFARSATIIIGAAVCFVAGAAAQRWISK